jgi:hypothetical protein
VKNKKNPISSLSKAELKTELKKKNAKLERFKRKVKSDEESHARALQIEAALEAVRSTTMAMFKSHELAETAVILIRQLNI